MNAKSAVKVYAAILLRLQLDVVEKGGSRSRQVFAAGHGEAPSSRLDGAVIPDMTWLEL